MWLYLTGLCVSLAGLAVLDYRYKLAFWHNAPRTRWTIGAAVGIFVIWDILGILLGIFFHGGSPWTLPLRILPEFPVEELFFLTLLCYVTLLLYRRLERA
jgi:lycopene cyclase domain-containing protein